MIKKFFAVFFVLLVLKIAFPELVKFGAVISLMWLAALVISEKVERKKLVWSGFASLVFMVSFVFFFGEYFQMTKVSIKEAIFNLDLRLGSNPETAKTRKDRQVAEAVELITRNADSLDGLVLDGLVGGARKNPGSSDFYLKEVLEISNKGDQRNALVSEYRRRVSDNSPTTTVQSFGGVSQSGESVCVIPPGDGIFVTDFVMVAFATYELKGFVNGEPSRYEMEYCGPGNQAMIREMASTTPWRVNGIPGNLTVKQMPSDTLVIKIKRVA